MIGGAELRLVARRANEVFGAAPLQLAMPMLGVRVLAWAIGYALLAAMPKLLYLLVYGSFCFLFPAAEYFASYLVADGYLQLRRGQGLKVRYASVMFPAVSVTVWSLWMRLLLWGMAAVAVAGALMLLFVFVFALFHPGAGLQHHSGLPHDWLPLLLVLAFAIFALLFSRYMFALPLQAMWGGRKPDAVAASLPLARHVRGTVLSIALAEASLTTLAPIYPLHLSMVRFGAGTWQYEGFLLLDTVLVSFMAVWFVALKTGLLERMAELERSSAGGGEASA